MEYRIVFIPEAVKDYKSLDGSVKNQVDKKLFELSKNPFLGEKLGNKHNMDLTGYLKIYVNNKSHRIVYRLLTPDKVEIVEVWGIGKRDKEEIYHTISKRIKSRI
jgi:mRNA interferase RelE/StbE